MVKKICLNMIVKNESKNVVRLFDTLIGIIDYWIISDTGSTDNTPEIIQKYFDEKQLPGELHHHVWKNFGHNRTLALRCAQKSTLDFDYILLLDADMKLVVRPSFNKNNLICDVYTLNQGSHDLAYHNVRLLKKTVDATCVGPTHEYYDIKGQFVQMPLYDLYINDIGDGGAKADKYERDIRLLKQGIEEEPDNVRYYFYLARSYECIGDKQNAIKYYGERIKRGSWAEEVWYSYFSIGNIYKSDNDNERAIYNYLMAYNANQYRLENIAKIIEIYRVLGKHQLSNMFIKIADEIVNSGKIVERDILFMEPPAYKYRVEYEKSIVYYYVGKRDAGLEVSDSLLRRKKILELPDSLYASISRNIRFYVNGIGTYGGENIGTFTIRDVPSIAAVENYENFKNVSNPSICKVNDEFWMNMRCINYKAEIKNDSLGYTVYDKNELVPITMEHPVMTTNIICRLDDTLNVDEQHTINNDYDEKLQQHKTHVQGIEDVRILQFHNKIYFVGNSRDCSEKDVPRMMLGSFDIDTKQFGKVVMLSGYEDGKCQKNWSPFVHNDKFLLLYSFSPLVILEPNLETGECSVYKSQPQTFFYDELKGGSQGFHIGNFIYFITHEVVYESGRIYYHRIVKMNDQLDIVDVSYKFYFDHIGIEFVSGAVYDQKREAVLISRGSNDERGVITKLLAKNLTNLFPKK